MLVDHFQPRVFYQQLSASLCKTDDSSRAMCESAKDMMLTKIMMMVLSTRKLQIPLLLLLVLWFKNRRGQL